MYIQLKSVNNYHLQSNAWGERDEREKEREREIELNNIKQNSKA